jgi:hypothetical protein
LGQSLDREVDPCHAFWSSSGFNIMIHPEFVVDGKADRGEDVPSTASALNSNL